MAFQLSVDELNVDQIREDYMSFYRILDEVEEPDLYYAALDRILDHCKSQQDEVGALHKTVKTLKKRVKTLERQRDDLLDTYEPLHPVDLGVEDPYHGRLDPEREDSAEYAIIPAQPKLQPQAAASPALFGMDESYDPEDNGWRWSPASPTQLVEAPGCASNPILVE